jgi:hypothetical protein
LAEIANREYVKGKKGKNQARHGRASCLATWSNKKVHVVITTRFRANGGASTVSLYKNQLKFLDS